MHCLDLAVAFLTRNISYDVRLMIEIDKIGQHIHFCPSNGQLLIPCFANLQHFRFRRRNKFMATDAGLHRRDHRRLSPARPAVTVLATHLELTGMDFMAEGDWLTRLQFLFLATVECDNEGRQNCSEIINGQKYSNRR